MNGGDVGLLMWMCGMSDPFVPIKPKGSWSYFGLTTRLLPFHHLPLPLAMSLINSHTFEHSMGHQISWEDARFHLHTSDGQHYPSN